MYQPPFNQYAPTGEPLFDQEEAQKHFEEFYEDVFTELAQFGELEELNVCANLGDHLMGNVYVKFREEDAARKALETCKGRYYGGRPLICEMSPVTDFREARCRQYDMGECARGGFCNFMHLRVVPRDLNRKVTDWQRKLHRKSGSRRSRSKSRSRSRDRNRTRRSRSRSRDRRRERRERSRSRERDSKERSSRKRERSRSRERDQPAAKRHESEQRRAEQSASHAVPAEQSATSDKPVPSDVPDAVQSL